MHWHQLTELSQLNDIITTTQQSAKQLTVLIFKHSTRCSISSMALNRLESRWKDNENVITYYLDLLNHREISNEIAQVFEIEHQSPQVLLIQNGKCFYHASHSAISVAEITEAITKSVQ